MTKECKSCGNYFSGERCDKCGWKPDKAAIMTDSEGSPSYEGTKDISADTGEEAIRHKDPNAGRNFLLTIIIASVVLAVFALWKSGAIFSNTREDVVNNYFTAISRGDYDSFVKCFPTEIKADYEQDMISSGLDKEAYMKELYSDLYSDYGNDLTIKATINDEIQLNKDDYDMSAYAAHYGREPVLDEVYEVSVDVEFSGETGSDKAALCLYVAKTGGRWRIFGMTEDMGLISEDNIA